jgi:hypothetical protein
MGLKSMKRMRLEQEQFLGFFSALRWAPLALTLAVAGAGCSGGGEQAEMPSDDGGTPDERPEQADAQVRPLEDGAGGDGWQPQKDEDGCLTMPPPTVPTAFELHWHEGDAYYLTWEEPAADYKAFEEALLADRQPKAACWAKNRMMTTRYDIYFGVGAEPPLVASDVAVVDEYCNYRLRATDGLCWYITGRGETPVQKGKYWLELAPEKYETYAVKLRVRNLAGESVSAVHTVSWGGPDHRCPGDETVVDQSGNSYESVQVGSQCWLNADLRVGTCMSGRQTDDGTVEKSCDPCSPGCPGYYSWRELMSHDALSSICPPGWHVPSLDEWKLLVNHADFSRFKLRYGGYKDSHNLKHGGPRGYYWTASRGSFANVAQAVIFPWPSLDEPIDLKTFDDDSHQLAARCVKQVQAP